MVSFKLLANLLLGLAVASAECRAKCPSGAHIIAVRGSLEPQGPGKIGKIANKIAERIPDSDIEALVYPALYEPDYVESQTEGVTAMTKLVNNYVKKCPNTKIVILGYSQGAHVTMDVMCGASSKGFPSTMPQPDYIAKQVAAIILLGDPSLVEGQPFHVGSSKGNGVLPRLRPEGCQAIVRKTVSICDAGDPFCEAGSKDLDVHMGYVPVYMDYAVERTLELFNKRFQSDW
ncbi:acetylxylan esterase 2 [Fusarium longipes]|uniref:Acetylxylan esterase 2 n=1 Tax=Fusarium longipes TaxID=694270 RepID=A0A395SQZ9_9HYPO|nr:acetylxylan esterase 2 [Fusarium longipes]